MRRLVFCYCRLVPCRGREAFAKAFGGSYHGPAPLTLLHYVGLSKSPRLRQEEKKRTSMGNFAISERRGQVAPGRGDSRLGSSEMGDVSRYCGLRDVDGD